jgi:hypothetical protein
MYFYPKNLQGRNPQTKMIFVFIVFNLITKFMGYCYCYDYLFYYFFAGLTSILKLTLMVHVLFIFIKKSWFLNLNNHFLTNFDFTLNNLN